MKLRQSIDLAWLLGLQDLKDTYRRSKLGTFWVTAAMGLQILTIGIVFSVIFAARSQDYIPYLASGVLIWTYITASIVEGSSAFIAASGTIKQLPVPLFVYTLRSTFKNLLVLGHNIIVLPIVFLIFRQDPGLYWLLSIVGFTVLTLNLIWISAILALISVRFRDLPPILNSLLLMAFYLTPVMWQAEMIPAGWAHTLLGYNPLYHLLQISRLPLLGELPTFENWALSVVLLAAGSSITLFLFKKFAFRVAYWV